MRYLEAWVEFDNGTSKMEHREDNNPAGRKAMDRWAFERLLSPRVVEVNVKHVNRYAGKGGSYR
jgi:hypothetical protein